MLRGLIRCDAQKHWRNGFMQQHNRENMSDSSGTSRVSKWVANTFLERFSLAESMQGRMKITKVFWWILGYTAAKESASVVAVSAISEK